MKQIDTFLNVDGGGDLVAAYNETIANLQADINTYQNALTDNTNGFNSRSKLAYDDAEKYWRNRDVSFYRSSCFKDSGSLPCYGKGKTGRGDRYDRRYGEAAAIWTKILSNRKTIAQLQNSLSEAIQAKQDAEAAINTAISQGTSKEDASAIAQAELDRIKAETAAALAASEAEIAQARAAAEANPNTKYYLIGAALLVGVTAFILIKRMK